MRKLFYLLLCLPLAFAACTEKQNDPEPIPTPKDPVLTLTSKDVMEIKADGGNGIITYTLENAVEGVELTAECEADWVENLTVGDNIVFSVPANEGDARETTVVVAYGETQSFNVTVKQAAKNEQPDNKPAFTLTSESEMEFGYDEAFGTITFEITNPINGVNVTAKANVDWISQVTPQADKIVFAVAANKGAAREGKITAEYGMLNFEVTVKQAEYVAPAPVITLETETVEVAAEGGEQTIAYTLENAVEGVETTASANVAWISNLKAENGTLSFTVAANEAGLRTGKVTLTHGVTTAVVSVSQLMPDADPNLTYIPYNLVSFKAQARGAQEWDINMSESHPTMGEMFTRISVKIAENNTSYIPDGVYSVENGGILVNGSGSVNNSYWRTNTSMPTDITICKLVVANDFENEISSISGSFQIGNEVYVFEYNDRVQGFMYEELGDDGITEWTSFKVQNQWDDCKYIVGKSPLGVDVEFYLHKVGGKKADPVAYGTYPVGDWESDTTRDYCEKTSKVNGIYISEGSVVVEENAAGYKFTFDVVDNNGTAWKGTYVGAL